MFCIFTFIPLFISLPLPQSIALFPKITIQEDGCQILIIGGGGGGGAKPETTKSVVWHHTFILKPLSQRRKVGWGKSIHFLKALFNTYA